MHRIFIQIYSNLKNASRLFFIIIILVIIGVVSIANKINIEEDISALIPTDDRINELNEVFSKSQFADQIIVNFYITDTTQREPNTLIEIADSLNSYLSGDTALVKNMRTTVNESAFTQVYDYFYRNLPIYLTNDDYKYLDTIVRAENLEELMHKNYKNIIAPTGIGSAKYILNDPLSLVPRCLERLKNFQLDDNFTIYNSHIFTKNKKHLLCFIDPTNSSKNTKINRKLVSKISDFSQHKLPSNVTMEYYGGTVVAVENANRITKDIYITITVALVLMFLFFASVFRSVKMLFILFTPVVLGVGIALCIMWLAQPSLSAIALGIGAILVGISIDFSLHYFSHVRFGHKPKQIIKAISEPIIMSSLTTASAFFCLYVVNSKALNQLGIFAGLSVVITSILALIILPQFFRKQSNSKNIYNNTNGFYEKLALYELHNNKVWLLIACILSVTFFMTSKYVKFNADIATLNYMPEKLQEAENNIKAISSEAASAIYVVATGNSLNQAISSIEQENELFNELKSTKIINNLINPTELIKSEEEQRKQINRWNTFWENKNIKVVVEQISAAGVNNHFKKDAFNSFSQLLSSNKSVVNKEDTNFIKELFLSKQIQETDSTVSLVAICKVEQVNKNNFFNKLKDNNNLLILDKQYFTNRFFDVLKDDFNKLTKISMAVVFLIVIIFFGRIETSVITLIPILLSWIWTMGLMVIFNVQFNIFNIIICTFIFGLGVDYSIFMTKGLININKYGIGNIVPYKVSILLSATTTLIGIGVLILAQHPAIKSIAMVTVLGIVSVVLITFTVIPLLVKLMFYIKNEKRYSPIVVKDILLSVTTFTIFLVGVIILSAIVLLFKIIPFAEKNKKNIVHYLVFLTCRLIVNTNVLITKKYIDKHKIDFNNPTVIICNHQSHLDIAIILALSPKIIVLTNEWVWKNPFYGFIIRYIDYYPIYTGINNGYDEISKKVKDGYSVLVFPEGTRTKDGNISRFHQGALSLADYLKLKISPVILHGAYECMSKKEFFLRSGHITLKFLEQIEVNKINIEEGITYLPQTKQITAFYREQYKILKRECENVYFFKQKLIGQYIYKGPVLEWYMRIKLKIENYYNFYYKHLPNKGKIIDVGCGYGFMINLLSYTKPQVEFKGWDYDKEKIKVAKEVGKVTNVNFEVKDVVTEELETADIFVFNDILHYFGKEKQKQVLCKAYNMLNKEGKIFIRDADKELDKRTKVTKWTEMWSIKILKFNKMKYELDFMSSSIIENFAKEKNMKFERIDNAKYTSNITYILSKTQ